jgi:hypothetical protein
MISETKPAADADRGARGRRMRARLALATAGAILVAGVILMIAILPAEYGVGSLGTGKLLGLASIAQAASAAPARPRVAPAIVARGARARAPRRQHAADGAVQRTP